MVNWIQGISMKNITMLTLAIAVVICLITSAGCIGTPGTSQPAAACPAVQQFSAVSFNATPVQYAQVNGVTLGYREFGSGEPVLMVQGFGNTIGDWNQTFIGILASKYHVYTYDHRGMGYSSINNATPTIPQYADDAAALMTALGYDSMHVYGVSMGSSVSQQLVIAHPERVRKLILDSSSYSIRVPETKKLLGSIEAAAVNPALPDGIHKEAQANLAWNGSYDSLSSIHKDVMLVVGTADDLTPDAVSVRMVGQINGSWLVRFKGLPHVGSHYAPVEYGENALNFLGTDESPLNK
jgi:pimeloyl-ACP methyl ester carboxylesterase